MLAIYWIQFIIALVFVCLRIYARRLTHELGRDDWILLVAMVRDSVDGERPSRFRQLSF